MFAKIEQAIDELKKGNIVIVCDDKNRENEGDFVALAEKVTPKTINFMIKHGRGLVCVPITKELGQKLSLTRMVDQNTDPYGTAFTVSIDHNSTITGISAHERALTIQEMLKPKIKPSDFNRPGHVFPLIAKEGGVLKRAGHTEAAVDLAILSGVKPAGVICEVVGEDGNMAKVDELKEIANKFGLKMITIKDLIQYRKKNTLLIKRHTAIHLPTTYGDFQAIYYSNKLDEKEHIAIVKGEFSQDEPVLVRIHSECLTGDVFGSKRCDCGEQLQMALQQIEAEEKGVLLYMRQEGRGIGLLNKMKAYQLQEEGLDTVEANIKLGFKPDLREYWMSAQILRDLAIKKVRLLTNNPSKIMDLEAYGMEVVERLPIQTAMQNNNEKYLRTKHAKMGHLLQF